MVDHLANAIEEQMKTQPNLSFEKASGKCLPGFWITGFGRILSEKRIAAEKQGRSMFWKFFKEHLRWPKVLVAIDDNVAFHILFLS